MNQISTKIDGRDYSFRDLKGAEQKMAELKQQIEQIDVEKRHLKKALKYFKKFLGVKVTKEESAENNQ